MTKLDKAIKEELICSRRKGQRRHILYRMSGNCIYCGENHQHNMDVLSIVIPFNVHRNSQWAEDNPDAYEKLSSGQWLPVKSFNEPVVGGKTYNIHNPNYVR